MHPSTLKKSTVALFLATTVRAQTAHVLNHVHVVPRNSATSIYVVFKSEQEQTLGNKAMVSIISEYHNYTCNRGILRRVYTL